LLLWQGATAVKRPAIEFDRDAIVNPGESFVDYILNTLGERAIKVEIGDYTGAISWGDPDVNGIRPHALTWSDGQWNYSLTADASPEKLVALGRDLVCEEKIGG
jgi:hypothetical protein